MKYFAYGSNMNTERMIKRGIRFSERKRAVLKGWKLMFNKMASRPGEGYANIVEDEREMVEGILYEIPCSDICKLDRYEGYPDHYIRVNVTVKLENGRKAKAVTYIANQDKVRDGLKPSKEYLRHLLKGSDLLSREYREMLRKIEDEAFEDPLDG